MWWIVIAIGKKHLGQAADGVELCKGKTIEGGFHFNPWTPTEMKGGKKGGGKNP